MRKKIALLAAAVLLGAPGLTVAATGNASATEAPPGGKVWICKFVGQPGADEHLKSGKNPIHVSVNATPLKERKVGAEFGDGHGRSVVVSIDDQDPGFEACEALLTPPEVAADVTLRVASVPQDTPAGSHLYVAGSFNGWNPADPAYELVEHDGVWTVTIPEGTGLAEYKFTRGSWETVEGDANGGRIDNHTFTFTDAPQTLDLSILSWEDLSGGGGESTAAWNVSVLSDDFFMPQLDRSRRIWLYLPPDYETSGKSYPVIYMHDGQNLFDSQTSFAGEWQVDETLNALFEQGDFGAIVVGIDNGGDQRLDEYSPWVNPEYGGGEGDAYVRFIADTLKPYINEHYRTLPQAGCTALFGSSMGGLISTYGAVSDPDDFGKVGAFSPSYWFAMDDLTSYIDASGADLSDTDIYFLASANEDGMAADIDQVRGHLQGLGLTDAHDVVKIDDYGGHNEAYWRGEFAAAYQWMFPADSSCH